jgi:CBS domain containing-hemolysin-like protein
MSSNLILVLVAVLILIADAIMAASRSALLNSRLSRLDELAEQDVAGAARAIRAATDATEFLISLRLGLAILRISLFAVGMVLLINALGEQANLITYALGLAGIGVVTAALEFLAEQIALRDPELWASRLSLATAATIVVLSPFGRLLLRLAGLLSGAEGGHHQPLVTEEEIMVLVDAGEEGGAIEAEEKEMIYSIFRLNDTLAREIMIPRIDILAFAQDISLVEATNIMLETGYSRAPVYRGSIDDVIGLGYVKDLLGAWRDGNHETVIGELVREAFFVPEAKEVDELLDEMQARRIQMAIVVDEYGGTAGLVTIEDIVEEIVGEIRDEYDYAEESQYQQLAEGEFMFSGGINLEDVNKIAEATLPKESSETLGGFVYSELGRVPSMGDSLEAGGLHLVVEQVVRRRIRRVRATRLSAEENREDSPAENNRTRIEALAQQARNSRAKESTRNSKENAT